MYKCSVLAPISYTDASLSPHIHKLGHIWQNYTLFPHRISITKLPLHTSLSDQQKRHSNSNLMEVTSYGTGYTVCKVVIIRKDKYFHINKILA